MQIGDTVTHYKIVSKLGEGGMGVVYKAEDILLQRHVALKFLPHHVTWDEESRQRFIHEARATSALDHPNICNIHEIAESDGQTFIVMACYDGDTLETLIKSGQLQPEQAVDICTQIADGLSKAHAGGIVHRDIKPANIIITKDGLVKILDFGLAKLSTQTRLTRTGSTLGTVAYMSPEQIRGGQVDHRSDIFSLGVVLYEMIAGQRPFGGDHDQAIAYSIVNEEPESIIEIATGKPVEIQRIIDKALQKSPEARYQHVDELINHLKESEISVSTKVRTQRTVKRRSGLKTNRAYFLAGMLALLAVLIIVVAIFFKKSDMHGEAISVLVLDIVNDTGEKELDGISEQLITTLEISRLLDVIPRYRAFDILNLLAKPDAERIDERIGKEICRYADVAVMVKPAIRRFGNSYVFDIHMIDPVKDEIINAEQEKGTVQDSIPGMIDNLAKKIRLWYNESNENISNYAQKTAEVFPQDYQAVQHYSQGEHFRFRKESRKAAEEYRRALAIDSSFGLAYYGLALTGSGYGEKSRTALLHKAMNLSDRIPEKITYLIKARLARNEVHWKAGVKILEEMETIYPNEKEMLVLLGLWCTQIKPPKLDKAVESLEKVLQMEPDYEPAIRRLCDLYFDLNRDEEGLRLAERYEGINPKQAKLRIARHYYQSEDYVNAEHYALEVLEIDSMSTRALRRLMWIYVEQDLYDKTLITADRLATVGRGQSDFETIAWVFTETGQFDDGIKILQDALRRTPERQGEIVAALAELLTYDEQFGWAETILLPLLEPSNPKKWQGLAYDRLYQIYMYQGRYREANRIADKNILLSPPNMDEKWHIRKACIKILGWNQVDEAKKYLEESVKINNRFWDWWQLWHFYLLSGDYTPADRIRIEKLLDSSISKYELILKLVEKRCATNASDRQLLLDTKPFFMRIMVLYFLANCQLQAGQLDPAVECLKELQQIYVNHWCFRPTYYPKSFYLLGKIYEMKGDTKQAIKNYEKLLELWKHADVDLIDMIDTKKRLANLKGVNTQ